MGSIDRFLNARISKKLLVLLICIILFVATILSEEAFMYIVFIYLGVQGVQDFAKARYNQPEK